MTRRVFVHRARMVQKKRISKKITSLTNKIAKEYGKKRPNKSKIGKLTLQAGRLLRKIKQRKPEDSY